MTTLPKIRIRYAWSTPYGAGPVYELREHAEEVEDARDSGADLLKLYVDEWGRIVHTEVVT